MIVRDLAAANETRRRVVSKGWESTRLLLKDDQMGFSFHITTIYQGAELPMCYSNHLEFGLLCGRRRAERGNRADGKVHPIGPGTIYILDQHDSTSCVRRPK